MYRVGRLDLGGLSYHRKIFTTISPDQMNHASSRTRVHLRATNNQATGLLLYLSSQFLLAAISPIALGEGIAAEEFDSYIGVFAFFPTLKDSWPGSRTTTRGSERTLSCDSRKFEVTSPILLPMSSTDSPCPSLAFSTIKHH